MTVAVLYGNMPHYDHGLSKVVKIITDTLTELGITVDEINLGYTQLPFYDGIKAQATDDIAQRLREASGLVLACTAQMFAPTAIMQSFLEYLSLDEYNDIFRGKLCLLATVSKEGGERSTLEYLSKVIQHLGGFDCVRVGLQEIHIRGLDTDAVLREFIEKETEDFYRALRQNRQFIIPRDYAGRLNLANLTGADVASLQPEKEKKEKVPVSEVYKRLNLDAFTEQQEQDILELTRLFAEKYTQPNPEEEPETDFSKMAPRPVKPRVKTVKQITQSMPHYFQPQLSAGLNAVIQFNITGAETFDGYLTVANTECAYNEGVSPQADITIIADASVWSDVLRHKYTAQKAFMIGGLKVRGNFVLLTKLDSLFKLNES